MPFVKRNDSGAIVAVFRHPVQEGLEELDARDPELNTYLYDTVLDLAARKEWIESDLGLVRVLEDLVQVLIEKGVLMYTDLPEAAQENCAAAAASANSSPTSRLFSAARMENTAKGTREAGAFCNPRLTVV